MLLCIVLNERDTLGSGAGSSEVASGDGFDALAVAHSQALATASVDIAAAIRAVVPP